jgi:hypothetical protein
MGMDGRVARTPQSARVPGFWRTGIVRHSPACAAGIKRDRRRRPEAGEPANALFRELLDAPEDRGAVLLLPGARRVLDVRFRKNDRVPLAACPAPGPDDCDGRALTN